MIKALLIIPDQYVMDLQPFLIRLYLLAAYYLGFWLGNQERGGFELGVGTDGHGGGLQSTQGKPDLL